MKFHPLVMSLMNDYVINNDADAVKNNQTHCIKNPPRLNW